MNEKDKEHIKQEQLDEEARVWQAMKYNEEKTESER